MSDTLPPDLRDLLTQISVQLGRIDTRLGHIEGDIGEIKTDARAFRVEVNDRFGAVEAHMDSRFGAVDARFDAIDARMDSRFGGVEARLRGQDETFTQIRVEVAGVAGRIMNIPNTWQMFAICLTTLVGLPVILGIALTLLRLLKVLP